ncbi:MAG: hypothetical protein CMI36_00005, partial [Owenweeksia sp.]|nr:hypothetical protein [Owenweeksia sp.]
SKAFSIPDNDYFAAEDQEEVNNLVSAVKEGRAVLFLRSAASFGAFHPNREEGPPAEGKLRPLRKPGEQQLLVA